MYFNILYISIDLFESDSEVFKYKYIHIDLYLQTETYMLIHAHTLLVHYTHSHLLRSFLK